MDDILSHYKEKTGKKRMRSNRPATTGKKEGFSGAVGRTAWSPSLREEGKEGVPLIFPERGKNRYTTFLSLLQGNSLTGQPEKS